MTINQAAGQADPTSTSPVVFSVVFSANVTGFTATDVNLSSSTAGGTLTAIVTQGADAAHYTVSVSGMTSSGSVIASIPAGAAKNSSKRIVFGIDEHGQHRHLQQAGADYAHRNNQPGAGAIRSHQRFADRLQCCVQRAGHRIHQHRC